VAGKLTPLQVPVVTLAEVLRDRGYATAAFTENGPLAHGRGFERGFDAYTENRSPIYIRPPGQIDRTFSQARSWLERHDSQRFFLFLHTFQVHSPYEPPPGYRELFDADNPSGAAGDRSARSVHQLISDYDREIRYVDDELRKLYTWLEARGLTENTVLVITSDHGEQFQEHGIQGHEAPPFEELTRIPLLLRGPGVAMGRRIAQPISQLDLMPTLLELVGAPVPTQVRGTSFARLLGEAEPEAGWAPRPLFTSGWVLPKGFQVPSMAVRVNDRKLIRTRTNDGVDRYSYFDLSDDPGETRNLFREQRIEAAELVSLLRRHERDAKATRNALRAGQSPGEPASPAFDPQRDEQLRALGYIE
jgi:arylsulfatase A-like enzyme